MKLTFTSISSQKIYVGSLSLTAEVNDRNIQLRL